MHERTANGVCLRTDICVIFSRNIENAAAIIVPSLTVLANVCCDIIVQFLGPVGMSHSLDTGLCTCIKSFCYGLFRLVSAVDCLYLIRKLKFNSLLKRRKRSQLEHLWRLYCTTGRPERARASGRGKSAYTNELPIRQSTSHKSTTSAKSSRATAGRACKTNGTNPAAIFSEAGPSSCLRPSSCKVTPAESRASRRSGAVAAGTSAPAVGGGQPVVTRQRSPWRPTNVIKPVRSSDAEVGHNGTRNRGVSVSPERRRRPTDRSRATSTIPVRRTKSVPVTSTLANNSDDLPKTSPVIEPSSCDRDKSQDETKMVERPQSRLPRPIFPVHSTKQTPENMPPASNVIARAVKSAWNKVSEVGDPLTSGGFLPVLAALLIVALAVVGGCAYTYINATPAPPPSRTVSPPQPSQPWPREPLSSSQSDTMWEWLQNVARTSGQHWSMFVAKFETSPSAWCNMGIQLYSPYMTVESRQWTKITQRSNQAANTYIQIRSAQTGALSISTGNLFFFVPTSGKTSYSDDWRQKTSLLFLLYT